MERKLFLVFISLLALTLLLTFALLDSEPPPF